MLEKKVLKLKEKIMSKENIIGIQEKKLQEIGVSVKAQLNVAKSMVDYNKMLSQQIAVMKNDMRINAEGEILEDFNNLWEYRESLKGTLIYDIISNKHLSERALQKDLESVNFAGIIKNLINLALELINSWILGGNEQTYRSKNDKPKTDNQTLDSFLNKKPKI